MNRQGSTVDPMKSFVWSCHCLFGTILVTLCFDGVGLAGFKSRAYVFLLA